MGGNDGHSFVHRIHMYNINAQQTGKLRMWTEVPNMKWNTRRLSSNTNTKIKTIHTEVSGHKRQLNELQRRRNAERRRKETNGKPAKR